MDLPVWRAVLQHKGCKQISVDTCMWATGSSRPWSRLSFIASSDQLLRGIKGFKCDTRHGHHVSYRKELWPISLCREIMYAISQMLIDYRRQMSFPIGVICQACERNWTRVHPHPTRVPAECKFPDDVSMDMKCPACLESKGRAAPGHTLTVNECRVPEM